jgi:hypothetical protein
MMATIAKWKIERSGEKKKIFWATRSLAGQNRGIRQRGIKKRGKKK